MRYIFFGGGEHGTWLQSVRRIFCNFSAWAWERDNPGTHSCTLQRVTCSWKTAGLFTVCQRSLLLTDIDWMATLTQLWVGSVGPSILFSVICSPPSTTAVFGSYLSSLYSLLTLFRWCGLAYPYDWRGFVGPKNKTVFNSPMRWANTLWCSVLIYPEDAKNIHIYAVNSFPFIDLTLFNSPDLTSIGI